MAVASVEAELAELKKLRALVPELKASVSSSDQKNVVLAKELGAAHDRIAALGNLEAQLASALEKVGQKDREIQSLRAELVSVNAKVDKADATLAAAKQIQALLDRIV